MTHALSRLCTTTLATALLVPAVTLAVAVPAGAAPDQTTTIANPAAIDLRPFGLSLPSSITVPSGRGTVTDVEVTLTDFSHESVEDITVMLVGPAGQRATLMLRSGAGAIANQTITFDDEDPDPVPTDGLPSGTYHPTDSDGREEETGAPASLSVFDGSPATGTWQLIAYDDFPSDGGRIAGGWSLTLDYNDAVAPSGTVAVAGGAAVVSTAAVTLDLTASDPEPGSGVTQVRLSNDGTNWSAFLPYTPRIAWTLVGRDGTKTVHAQFADGLGNISARASDTVVLDSTGPTAGSFKPTGKKVDPRPAVSFVASEALDPATITHGTVQLTTRKVVVRAKVRYVPTARKVVLKPLYALERGTRYRVVVSRSVTDVVGNAMTARGGEVTWAFTTR